MKRVVIGPAPLNEMVPLAKKGRVVARKAAEVFARQLLRQLGAPPPGVHVAVGRVRDGQRTVYCAVCFYDDADERALEYAWRCEDQAPLNWDEIARAELGDKNDQS
jgi:hypothetical protein